MKSCSVNNCNWPSWGKDKKTGKPYCKMHQSLRTDKDKRSPIQKHFDSMKEKGLVNGKGGLIVDKTEEYLELEQFFELAAKAIRRNPHCWETGDFISEADYRAATAHIFPKSIFLSIACHPLNFLVLSARNGSHNKTHRLDTFSKMDVFPIAIKRFKEFEHLITEKHKYLTQFKKLAEDYIQLQKTKPTI